METFEEILDKLSPHDRYMWKLLKTLETLYEIRKVGDPNVRIS